MLTLGFPWLLGLLPLPLLCGWLLPAAKITLPSALKFPFPHHLTDLPNSPYKQSVPNNRWRAAACLLLWIALVVAASAPRWLGDVVTLPREGRDIMLVMDISGSMQIEDMVLKHQQVDRLTAVQQVASHFIQRRQGDRIGLILFGSKAYLQTPLTFDRQTVISLLKDATIGLAGPQTAIGDALGLGIKHLLQTQKRSRVLILLTDGVNTAGSLTPTEAGQLAIAQDIPIYTIGIGADSVRVYDAFGTRDVNPSADLDEPLLTAIAKQTGGAYFRAKDTETLQKIYRTIDQLHPTVSEQASWRPMQELYVWPLSLALGLSILLSWRYLQIPWPWRRQRRQHIPPRVQHD